MRKGGHMSIIKYIFKVVDEDNTRFFDYMYIKFGAWFALALSIICLIFATIPPYETGMGIEPGGISSACWAGCSFVCGVIFFGLNKKLE